MEELTEHSRALLKKLLKAFGRALHLPDEEYLLKIHKNLNDDKVISKSTIRSLYYPPLPDDFVIPSNGIRCRGIIIISKHNTRATEIKPLLCINLLNPILFG